MGSPSKNDVGAAVFDLALGALQKVAHMAGQRTPHPVSHHRSSESPYAASEGLTDPQMATALALLGYAATRSEIAACRLAACLPTSRSS